MSHYLMLDVPLFHFVLVAVAIVVVSLFNFALFQYCAIRCCIVLMLHYFNFGLFFAALFNNALIHHFTI